MWLEEGIEEQQSFSVIIIINAVANSKLIKTPLPWLFVEVAAMRAQSACSPSFIGRRLSEFGQHRERDKKNSNEKPLRQRPPHSATKSQIHHQYWFSLITVTRVSNIATLFCCSPCSPHRFSFFFFGLLSCFDSVHFISFSHVALFWFVPHHTKMIECEPAGTRRGGRARDEESLSLEPFRSQIENYETAMDRLFFLMWNGCHLI